jgi:hypothetical protein
MLGDWQCIANRAPAPLMMDANFKATGAMM